MLIYMCARIKFHTYRYKVNQQYNQCLELSNHIKVRIHDYQSSVSYRTKTGIAEDSQTHRQSTGAQHA